MLCHPYLVRSLKPPKPRTETKSKTTRQADNLLRKQWARTPSAHQHPLYQANSSTSKFVSYNFVWRVLRPPVRKNSYPSKHHKRHRFVRLESPGGPLKSISSVSPTCCINSSQSLSLSRALNYPPPPFALYPTSTASDFFRTFFHLTPLPQRSGVTSPSLTRQKEALHDVIVMYDILTDSDGGMDRSCMRHSYDGQSDDDGDTAVAANITDLSQSSDGETRYVSPGGASAGGRSKKGSTGKGAGGSDGGVVSSSEDERSRSEQPEQGGKTKSKRKKPKGSKTMTAEEKAQLKKARRKDTSTFRRALKELSKKSSDDLKLANKLSLEAMEQIQKSDAYLAAQRVEGARRARAAAAIEVMSSNPIYALSFEFRRIRYFVALTKCNTPPRFVHALFHSRKPRGNSRRLAQGRRARRPSPKRHRWESGLVCSRDMR